MADAMATETFKIVLTSMLTIFGGTIVLTLGQVIVRFVIEPIHEQFRLIGEFGNSLGFYADVYSNPGSGRPEAIDEAAKVLRQQAGQLRARNRAIPWYGLWEKLRFAPKRDQVVRAAKNLIGLSNGIHGPNADGNANDALRRDIERGLGIEAAG